MIKKIMLVIALIVSMTGVKADEGMWMLPYIEKLNIQKMQGLGCTLTAEEIYSTEQISLKDAVIVFGGGCTGVVVSDKGLVFTNHHCGYGAIQQLSAVDHNYLKDGFTAKELKDEIPSPGLTVKFLVSITDVTDKVNGALINITDLKIRTDKQDSVVNVIKKEFEKDNDYIVQVRSFYSGNEFYVFVLEEFKDVRFAYAPPSSIGKFGGDTDNWMWPRHTGDFSVFRVYSDVNGKPAEYSANNVPYSPKRFATISTNGYKPGDYAMIIGNPGSTSRYLTSWAIKNRTDAINRARIDVRGAKQDTWLSFMKNDEAINIAYASKFARSSNYWKNSIGMNKALEELGVPARKKAEEKTFADWVNADPARRIEYGQVLPVMEEKYAQVFPVLYATNFLRESLVGGVEMPRIASEVAKLLEKKQPKDSVILKAKEIYKDYYMTVDQATFSVMLETYKKYVDAKYLPALYTVIDKKFKGDYKKYTASIFEKSSFSSYEKFVTDFKKRRVKVKKDPALIFRNEVNAFYEGLQNAEYKEATSQLRNAERLYEAGLKEISVAKGISRYPDANSTMRLTYGTIESYEIADAIIYNYYSTTNGILQKEKPGDMEFDVPPVLKKAIVNKDFGTYADAQTGKMMVNFLSNNDITGGNSGSPIFNGKGQLLGLAFDGNWEAMSGDIVFEPELQRTINIDVRYLLFIMEKVGGADRLLKELKIEK